MCLEGACTFELDDGRGATARVRLDRMDQAILLPARVWRVYRDFEPGTKMLVIADTPYDEADYIRDRAEFERLVAEDGGRKTDDGGRKTARPEVRGRRSAEKENV